MLSNVHDDAVHEVESRDLDLLEELKRDDDLRHLQNSPSYQLHRHHGNFSHASLRSQCRYISRFTLLYRSRFCLNYLIWWYFAPRLSSIGRIFQSFNAAIVRTNKSTAIVLHQPNSKVGHLNSKRACPNLSILQRKIVLPDDLSINADTLGMDAY